MANSQKEELSTVMWFVIFVTSATSSFLCCVLLYLMDYLLLLNLDIYMNFLAFFGLPMGSLIGVLPWSIFSKNKLCSIKLLSGYITSTLVMLILWLASETLGNLPGGDNILVAVLSIGASLGFCVGIAFSKRYLRWRQSKIDKLCVQESAALLNGKSSVIVRQLRIIITGAITAFLFGGLLYLTESAYLLLSTYSSPGAGAEDIFLGFLTFFGLPMGCFLGVLVWNIFSKHKLHAANFLSGYISSILAIFVLWIINAAMGGRGSGAYSSVPMRNDVLFIVFPIVASLGFCVGMVFSSWWSRLRKNKIDEI